MSDLECFDEAMALHQKLLGSEKREMRQPTCLSEGQIREAEKLVAHTKRQSGVPKPPTHFVPGDPVSDVYTIVAKLEAMGLRVDQSGSSFLACCPAHDDKTPSLSIGVGTKQPVVLYCHAGCSQDEVLQALDICYHQISNPRPERFHDDHLRTAKALLDHYERARQSGHRLTDEEKREERWAFRYARGDRSMGVPESVRIAHA